MSFVSKQTKGSGILTFIEGGIRTIVIVKHITKINYAPSSSCSDYHVVYIYTIAERQPIYFNIAKTEEKALTDFIITEQNPVKAKSVTGTILAAAGFV